MLVGAWLLGSSLVAAAPPVSSAPEGADQSAIRQVLATYVKAVDTADAELAATIWADLPEVSFIHPRGHERGLEAIRTGVYEQAMGQTFTKRQLTVKDVAIRTHGDSGWAEFDWDFSGTLRKDGSPIETHGRETQIYWKLGDAWRLVHVHYSAMPAPAEP
jgi:uncharacterized protein (TIGR02246 family)